MPRVIEINTPLGPDVLLFHRLRGRDELSRVNPLRLELLSEKENLKFDDLLGKNVTVTLMLQDDSPRFFNGYITRFAQGGTYGRYHRYFADMHSWMWFLSRTADCRIFQDMTVPEIIKKVFADEATSAFKDELTGVYRKWTYCVQYRETDLNFVSRLMEQEGIYFYVKHEDGKHTVVLADSYSAHAPFQSKPLPFIAPEDLGRRDIEHISSWSISREVQPGVFVHDDYDMERPKVELRTSKAVVRPHSASANEIYDYPGEYLMKNDGEAYASVRIDEFSTQFETAEGVSNARNMQVGSLFTLERQIREDQDREYLIVGATYDMEYSDYEAMPERGGAEYRCSFTAMSSAQQFRTRRTTPKPFVQGPQTAVVVGPPGDEIYTDKYGRVKVLFHWDREGEKKRNEECSCWVRVSQPWAGQAWGGVAIPRIGQEVIVDFLEGDPDQPIITGRVYNAEQMPPYALPANMTATGIKSRSSKGGTPANFNEIRFEDKKGAEHIFINAEKDLDMIVEYDRREFVGHAQHLIVGDGGRTDEIEGEDHLKVKLKRVEEIGADNEVKILGSSITEIGGDEHLKVKGDLNADVGAQYSLKTGSDLVLDAGTSVTESAGQKMYLKAGMTLVIEAGMQLTLKGPGGFVTIDPSGVTIQGTLVRINSGGAAGSGSATAAKAPKAPGAPRKPVEAENKIP